MSGRVSVGTANTSPLPDLGAQDMEFSRQTRYQLKELIEGLLPKGGQTVQELRSQTPRNRHSTVSRNSTTRDFRTCLPLATRPRNNRHVDNDTRSLERHLTRSNRCLNLLNRSEHSRP